MNNETETPETSEITEIAVSESDNITQSQEATNSYNINELLADDLSELAENFSELSGIKSVAALPNATRYAALRDLGLTPTEAYKATSPLIQNTRAHLKSSMPKCSRPPVSTMTGAQWREARELFEDMSDSEIEKLYKSVTKQA